ncbi:unnamed protein product [Spirodela intermedia]|uniref:Uncharacterized protein n=1 Tax=Spirodela intermedia TaxID=51605 RepID=A0A7I8L5G4_SPIIN|nr:unnamed protein product [Spirodela intermedia]
MKFITKVNSKGFKPKASLLILNQIISEREGSTTQ